MRHICKSILMGFALGIIIQALSPVEIMAKSREEKRHLWGSVADDSKGWLTNVPELMANKGKVLLSWRMLPSDTRIRLLTCTCKNPQSG